MSKIFISYHRSSQAVATSLVKDLGAMGHTVWFDQELAGGQSWWNRILAMIRETDAFIFVLDPESLASTACKREYIYAADVGKAVVPVLTADGVSINLLPPALSQIQIVDYRSKDREAILRLVRALTALPAPSPLPDPLPVPPTVPLSHLGTLTEQIDQAASLTYEAQSALVVDLRANVRDPDTKADAVTLLRRLRKRRDLFASIAEEIDEFLRADVNKDLPGIASERPIHAPSEKGPVEPSNGRSFVAEISTRPDTTARAHSRGLIAGFCALVGGSVFAAAGWNELASPVPVALLLGALPSAVAGAIAGKQPLPIAVAAIGGVLGFVLVLLISPEDGRLGGLIAVGPGLICGAIVGAGLYRWRKAAGSSPEHF